MVADGLDVDFERFDVCGGDELMFQGYEQYDDGSIAISAAETAVAIAIMINIYRNIRSIQVNKLDELKW